MEYELDRGIAVGRRAPGEYAADLDAGWVVGGGLNGGYLLAVIGERDPLRAHRQRAARPGQRQCLLPQPERPGSGDRPRPPGPHGRPALDGCRQPGPARGRHRGRADHRARRLRPPRGDDRGCGAARDTATGPPTSRGLCRRTSRSERVRRGRPAPEAVRHPPGPGMCRLGGRRAERERGHPGLVQAGRRPAPRPDRPAGRRGRPAAGDLRPGPAGMGAHAGADRPRPRPAGAGWAIVRHATRNISGGHSRRIARSGTPAGTSWLSPGSWRCCPALLVERSRRVTAEMRRFRGLAVSTGGDPGDTSPRRRQDSRYRYATRGKLGIMRLKTGLAVLLLNVLLVLLVGQHVRGTDPGRPARPRCPSSRPP